MYPGTIETCDLCGIECADAIEFNNKPHCDPCWRARENSRRAALLKPGDACVVEFMGKRCPARVESKQHDGLVVSYTYGDRPHEHGRAVFDGVFSCGRQLLWLVLI